MNENMATEKSVTEGRKRTQGVVGMSTLAQSEE